MNLVPFRRRRAARPAGPAGRERGQTLVEFALVFPIFVVVLMSMIEFAFYFNALLGVSFASRDAALAGATAGANANADCAILQNLETSIGSPINKAQIQQVAIYKSNRNGGPTGVDNIYSRSGSTNCTSFTGVAFTVPYTRTATGYPELNRCDVQLGCTTALQCPGTGAPCPIDSIGVTITFRYTWKTPLSNLVPGLGGGSGGITFTRSNAMRMEPNN